MLSKLRNLILDPEKLSKLVDGKLVLKTDYDSGKKNDLMQQRNWVKVLMIVILKQKKKKKLYNWSRCDIVILKKKKMVFDKSVASCNWKIYGINVEGSKYYCFSEWEWLFIQKFNFSFYFLWGRGVGKLPIANRNR